MFEHSWFQSDRIDIFVDGSEKPFQIPQDFLQKRSRVFQALVEQQRDINGSASLTLRDVTPEIFKTALLWFADPQPTLNPDTTAEVLVELGFFAEKYEVAVRSER
jgi:hypothetical protein